MTPGSQRRLGNSSLFVGPISYGCWRFAGTAKREAHEKIATALECGMNLIDTADIYGFNGGEGSFGTSEELLGKVLTAAPELREQMVLATKGGIQPGVPYDSTRTYLIAACEQSLRRLNVDTIDLYQVHRPDVLCHPAEVAAALGELVASGKVRAVGVSNYTPSQLDALLAHAVVPLATSQPEFSLWRYEAIDDGVLDRAMQHQLTPLAWSPLGRGAISDETTPLGAAIASCASRHGVSSTAVALAWVMHHPSGAIPIIGTQRVDRIRDAAVATTVQLDRSEQYALLAAAGRHLP